MENVFCIGGQVSGDSFIGRKSLLVKFRDTFSKNTKVTKAIIGLTRIGKTSFVRQVFKDFPKENLIINEDLNEWSTYEEMWQDILIQIEAYLQKYASQNEFTDEILENIALIEKGNLIWVKFNRTIKNIFESLNEAKIRTILILDEFDNAQKIFSEGTKHFELLRTLLSDSKYNISAITISRRNLHTIEGTTYMSSTFHGILDPVYFKGFNNEDFEEYYNIFKNNNVCLSDEQKKQIQYYAGNLPFLLSILGHYILECAKYGDEIVISKIFENKCNAINDYYRDCIKHLERDQDINKILPFVTGPNLNVTQNDRDEMINLGYLKIDNGEYLALSHHFMILVSKLITNDTWSNLINLEKYIKNIIHSELLTLVKNLKLKGKDLKEIELNLLKKTDGISDKDISRYDSFIFNNYKTLKVKSDYVDVMSLKDCIKIMNQSYHVFKKFFDNELQVEVISQLDKCGEARNPIAHGHEEYLSEASRIMVNTYCDNYLKVFYRTARKLNSTKDKGYINLIINASCP
jgi:hypothetical protein